MNHDHGGLCMYVHSIHDDIDVAWIFIFYFLFGGIYDVNVMTNHTRSMRMCVGRSVLMWCCRRVGLEAVEKRRHRDFERNGPRLHSEVTDLPLAFRYNCSTSEVSDSDP